MDVRVKTGADVASEHHFLVGRGRLKLKNYHTRSEKTSHKYQDAEGCGNKLVQAYLVQ